MVLSQQLKLYSSWNARPPSTRSVNHKMPRRKRVKEDDKSELQQKKQKMSSETRRSTRGVLREESPSSSAQTNGIAERGNLSKNVEVEEPIVTSDSSDLSDAPSQIVPPTSPKPTIPKPKRRKTVVKKSSQVKNPTAKEHEDALDKFIRDDSDDDLSDTPSESKLVNGVAEQSGDSDEEDWEDVDLSHRKDVSLDNLNGLEEPAGLEVTLEKTQQSMRIKYNFPSLLGLTIGIKRLVLPRRRQDFILIYFTFNVCFTTEQ